MSEADGDKGERLRDGKEESGGIWTDECGSRSPIAFTPNGTLSLNGGAVVRAQVSEGFGEVMLRVDGKLVTLRRI